MPAATLGRFERQLRLTLVLLVLFLAVLEHQVRDVGIGLALPAEGRGLSVARHELDVVAERP